MRAEEKSWVSVAVVLVIRGLEVTEVRTFANSGTGAERAGVVPNNACHAFPWFMTQRWSDGGLNPLWVVFYEVTDETMALAEERAWGYFDSNAPSDLLALAGRKRRTHAETGAAYEALRRAERRA